MWGSIKTMTGLSDTKPQWPQKSHQIKKTTIDEKVNVERLISPKSRATVIGKKKGVSP